MLLSECCVVGRPNSALSNYTISILSRVRSYKLSAICTASPKPRFSVNVFIDKPTATSGHVSREIVVIWIDSMGDCGSLTPLDLRHDVNIIFVDIHTCTSLIILLFDKTIATKRQKLVKLVGHYVYA